MASRRITWSVQLLTIPFSESPTSKSAINTIRAIQEMVRFDSPEDIGYRRVKGELQRWIRDSFAGEIFTLLLTLGSRPATER
jgi:hypothetical protein